MQQNVTDCRCLIYRMQQNVIECKCLIHEMLANVEAERYEIITNIFRHLHFVTFFYIPFIRFLHSRTFR